MSGPKHFDEPTHWDVRPDSIRQGWTQGWVPPNGDFYIGSADHYWGRVLDQARKAYGDPNIRFDTDDVHEARHLVFGDGHRLPADGTIVYHDTAAGRDYQQNVDGTTSLIGPDGHPGAPAAPVAYRRSADGSYAPLDARGQQVAPLQTGIPLSDNGLHTDPATGWLTPKNAAGDYYTLGPDGSPHYFDRNGAPISATRFGAPAPAPAPTGSGLGTDEQQSGRAADAVAKLQGELKDHYSAISAAEEKLTEVLLSAHAANADGQRRLNDIQHTITDAVANPAMSWDSPAGQNAFLQFLRGQLHDISDVVNSGDLTADDQAAAARALAALYGADPEAGHPEPTGEPPSTSQPGAPTLPATSTPIPEPEAAPSPALSDPALTDPGLGPAEPMPAPLPDGLAGDPLGGLGGDGLAGLAPLLPGALSGLGASPLDSLGGLAGPLTGLTSPLGSDRLDDHGRAEHDDDHRDAGDSDTTDHQHPHPAADPPPTGVAADTAPGAGAAPAGPAAAPAAPTTVVALPDGSTTTARSPALARAVTANLAGTPADTAFREAGITLPPPGTPVTNPVDPSALSCGCVGMFKDRYVVALSTVKAFQDGQVVPLAAVASSPDFLGWVDPTASTTGGAAPVPAPPAAAPAPAGAR